MSSSEEEQTDLWISGGLGLSVLHAAAQQLYQGYGASLEGATLICLNALVGILFLARRRGGLVVGRGDALVCLASVLLSGLALKLAPPLGQWPRSASILFASAGGAAMVALLSLGRSFAVLPSYRGLVQRGPFRLVRHPIYTAELCMVAATCWAAQSWAALLLFSVIVALVAWRIQIEERALARQPEHAAYRQAVRWKLLPGLW